MTSFKTRGRLLVLAAIAAIASIAYAGIAHGSGPTGPTQGFDGSLSGAPHEIRNLVAIGPTGA